MGRKSEPSVTSGELGVNTEIINIGGVSVTGGVSVDISPIDLGVNYDPAENSLGIAGSAQIPGGVLGVAGGVTIDLDTGEVTGGKIGAEVLGFGVTVSNSKDGGLGVSVSFQIPFTPIEIELGFSPRREKKEEKPRSTIPGGPSDPNPNNLPTSQKCKDGSFELIVEWGTRNDSKPLKIEEWLLKTDAFIIANYSQAREEAHADKYFGKDTWYSFPMTFTEFAQVGNWVYIADSNVNFFNNYWFTSVNEGAARIKQTYTFDMYMWKGYTLSNPSRLFFTTQKYIHKSEIVSIVPPPPCSDPWKPPPPFSNPPPRKRNMNECCRESIKLQRLIVRHLGAASPTSQELLPDGVKGIGSAQEGIRQAYPFLVRKRWIDPTAKDNEGIPITNDRQLALVLGGMIERLERVLGTAKFYKDSDKKLRQSEGNMLSWVTGKNKDFNYPDPNDFWVNTDDGIINEKLLEVRSIADGLRYQIEALNRLERILPIAELKDSSIPARWIHPNGTGQLRVGNLIHLCEYMIRKDDRDRGYWPQNIQLVEPNPAVEDDKGIDMDFHSQADLLRFLVQKIVDTEGDVDMGSNYDLRRTYLDIMAFQLTVKNNRYLQAITEFMNFDMTESVDNVPIPFDFFAGQNKTEIQNFWNKYGLGDGDEVKFPTSNVEEEIERLSEGVLQNSEIEINTVKFGSSGDEETGTGKEPKTLKEMLIEILKHSSTSAAAVTEKVTEGALERAVEAASLARKVEAFLQRRNIKISLGIGDLDNWITSAEKGYTDNPESDSLRFPESDASQPYGRPTTQNPSIREIDTKNPQAD
jgi:hypothetical protein